MTKTATQNSAPQVKRVRTLGPAEGVVAIKRTAAERQFQKFADALKPMSKQGSISMAQAKKAVQDYIRSSAK